MKKQVIVIHGADAFDSYEEYISFLKDFEIENLDYFRKKRWKESLQEKLGPDFDVLAFRMPNTFNAKYFEWKIWFDKIVPLLSEKVILVGHSMGGIFLIKYLTENDFPKIIESLHLIAAPYENADDWVLADFNLPGDLSRVLSQTYKIYLYHSKDDEIVPFSHLEKYKKHFPQAREVIFEDRGHFSQTEFPELVENIINS